jgi:pimeloyl-ACP methyl ester carboxylesterase
MASPSKFPIPAAKLLSSKSHVVPGQLLVTELLFQVPLDYANPSAGTITLFARRAAKHDVPIVAPDDAENKARLTKPYMVFLEGGPGFGNREPQEHVVTRPSIARGYQVLFLDYRGVGLSTPVSAAMLGALDGGVDAQVAYLKLMRQDNSVRDCEAVRKCLTEGWSANKAKWSIFGQSYGGFVSLSYLSMHPEGLREVFLTGGLAPVGKTADQVYKAVFPRVVQRNEAYYKKFPEDIANVKQIASYIEKQGGRIPLPAGGFLTVPRLLTLGLAFGGHGGFDSVHSTLLQLKTSLDQFGYPSRASLVPLEGATPFDTNIIYAILHEPIYCDGPGYASAWAANRVGKSIVEYFWLDQEKPTISSEKPLYFSGEMIFPFHFETYPELIALQEVAEALAQTADWPPLYDKEQLSQNEVPVYAASYIDDMYVDCDFARDTAQLVKGTKVFETNVMYHSALRAKSDEVLQNLFALRDDVID